jgi:hypothetical protein
LLVAGWYFYQTYLANPRVTAALHDDPNGTLAGRVMLLSLPSGKSLPVNYLQEGDKVFAGSDGRWWRELAGAPMPVTVLIRGATRRGLARAVRDDPVYTEAVFKRLRPDSYKWIGGVLVEIDLEPEQS